MIYNKSYSHFAGLCLALVERFGVWQRQFWCQYSFWAKKAFFNRFLKMTWDFFLYILLVSYWRTADFKILPVHKIIEEIWIGSIVWWLFSWLVVWSVGCWFGRLRRWEIREVQVIQSFQPLHNCRILWGLVEDFLMNFWGLSEDILRTFWGLSEYFLRTFSGLSQDFLRLFYRLSNRAPERWEQ